MLLSMIFTPMAFKGFFQDKSCEGYNGEDVDFGV
jgi:hypothetical protein